MARNPIDETVHMQFIEVGQKYGGVENLSKVTEELIDHIEKWFDAKGITVNNEIMVIMSAAFDGLFEENMPPVLMMALYSLMMETLIETHRGDPALNLYMLDRMRTMKRG